MGFSNACPQSRCEDYLRAVTLNYGDLSPVLEAGYRRSVGLTGEETAHFAVVKTCGEFKAVRPFLAPFCGDWSRREAIQYPTIVVVAMKMAARGAMNEYLESLHCACVAVVAEMKQCADQLGLETHVHVHRPASLADYRSFREQCVGLRIPSSFIPLGVFGASYSV